MSIEQKTDVTGDTDCDPVSIEGDPRDARIRELEARVAELEAERRTPVTRDTERTRQWLDNILGSIQDDFYVLDREWRFTYASDLFTNKVGRAPGDFIGRCIWDLFPKHLGTNYEENLRAAMERREIRRFEVTGKYTDAIYRMTVFPSDEGVTVIGSDVTAQKKAEAALRESQAALQAFYDSSPLMMGIAELEDDDVNILYANSAFAQFFGTTPDCIVNRPVLSLGSSGEVQKMWLDNYRRCQKQGTPQRFEYVSWTKGHPRWVSATVSFLGTSSVGRAHFSFIAEDVTSRHEVLEALARSEASAKAQAQELDAIIDAISDGLNITDAEGNLIRINRAGTQLLGYACPEEYRRTLLSFTELWTVETADGEPLPVERWPSSRALRGETFIDEEHTIRRLDRDFKLSVSSSGTTIRNDKGEIVKAIVTYRDVTGLVEARRHLSAANAQLVELDRRKNKFMAMLSHELRNPLAPIKNCLSILDQASPTSDQARRAKQTIRRQVDQLVRLVDDLLDITRITRGKIELQPEPLDLNDLVFRTLEDHRSLFEQGQIRFEYAPAPSAVWVHADPNRLAQAVGNLLLNSAKFTPREGLVSVSVVEETDQAIVTVRDTGIGMEPEVLSRLFQAFVQADATMDRSKGGLGLGLALVKGLVELHGGSVEANSEGLHKGCEVCLKLPRESANVRPPEIEVKGPKVKSQRVLIIEDNTDAADSLGELLELEQHEVAVAYDGPSGMAKARELRPTVVLCDIGLPGMNGYEVARAIRTESLPLLCLVALSGYSLREDIARAKEAGFDRHLAKPPDLAELRALFASLSDNQETES